MITSSEYRKKLDEVRAQYAASILSKVRTDTKEELNYHKGLMDGIVHAIRLLDELENHGS